MNGSATIQAQRIAFAMGVMVVFVILLAMFTAPREAALLSPSPPEAAGAAEQTAAVRFTLGLVLGLLVTGLVAGTLGGMMGMGGGVMKMTCLLLLFGFHPGLSKFAALLSYFAVAAGASCRYRKLRLVQSDVVKILVPASVVGLVLGALAGHHLSREPMLLLLGLFLLFTAVVMAKRMLCVRLEQRAGDAGAPAEGGTCGAAGWKVALSGFPGGFLCAMLGISGGVVTTPLQHVVAGIPIKNAIANTLLKATITVPMGALFILVLGLHAGHFELWHALLTALCLIPGSLVGSQLGPSLTARMRPMAVHVVFGALALGLGIYMLFFAQ